jgi:hypothetical protein
MQLAPLARGRPSSRGEMTGMAGETATARGAMTSETETATATAGTGTASEAGAGTGTGGGTARSAQGPGIVTIATGSTTRATGESAAARETVVTGTGATATGTVETATGTETVTETPKKRAPPAPRGTLTRWRLPETMRVKGKENKVCSNSGGALAWETVDVVRFFVIVLMSE